MQERDGNEQLMSASVLDDHALQTRQGAGRNADPRSRWDAWFPADGQPRCDEALDLPKIMYQLLGIDDREGTQDTFRLQRFVAVFLTTVKEDVSGKEGQPRDQLASSRGAMRVLDKGRIEGDSCLKQPIHEQFLLAGESM